jgi:molybdenum cofactor cytidylyltransferase
VGGEARAALRSVGVRGQADLKIVGLLLAAGSASRFGSDKLRHSLPHGVAIAVQAARHLRAEVERVIAVVRPSGDELAAALKAEGCEVVVCENAAEGMGASLACAARAAAHFYSPLDGYIVALGDMPFVRPSTIAAVRDAVAGGAALAAPYFRARRGHPVGIAGRFAADLLALQGDEGAKRLLGAHEQAIVKIPVGDPGVIRDIDRPEDLVPPLRV